MSDWCTTLSELVIEGRVEEIQDAVRAGLRAAVPSQTLLDEGLLRGMDAVGKSFKDNEMFIPEVLLSAQTMEAAMEILRPLLAEGAAAAIGSVVIGTVEGDIHNIGKNLVVMMLEGAGFEVIDLGVDVKPTTFVEAVKEYRPDIVAMSALLTTTMPKLSETMHALEEVGVRDHLKIMVGGAPLTKAFADRIGADGFGTNAVAAAEEAKKLMRR